MVDKKAKGQPWYHTKTLEMSFILPILEEILKV